LSREWYYEHNKGGEVKEVQKEVERREKTFMKMVDRFFRCDVGHGLAMLVSPLVLFFHPLDPIRVGRVEG
jgi:hypothetical protein